MNSEERYYVKNDVIVSWLVAGLVLGVAGCGGAPVAEQPHGTLSELSRVEGEIVLCDHEVPEKVCTRHHPELVPRFQRVGDWCEPHGVPESQCLECHPDLTFEPLPKLSADADVKVLSQAGEDVPDLARHAVQGKVTVFEFYADWCAICRKVDGHMYKRLAAGDESFAYRRLNVVDWDSPLGQRYMKEVPNLPLIIVYGPDGKRFRALYGADLPLLDRTVAEAAER